MPDRLSHLVLDVSAILGPLQHFSFVSSEEGAVLSKLPGPANPVQSSMHLAKGAIAAQRLSMSKSGLKKTQPFSQFLIVHLELQDLRDGLVDLAPLKTQSVPRREDGPDHLLGSWPTEKTGGFKGGPS